jgi:hypothetical protein
MGNDFFELEDLSRPHLNDYCEEVPAKKNAPFGSGAVARFDKLALPEEAHKLFSQGLNQAVYLMEHPEREDLILKKARKCIILLKSIARQYDSSLLFVLLPSYDMVFPDQTKQMSAYARNVVENKGNMRLLSRIENILDGEGCDLVNLLPVFVEGSRPFLYANDFHIWQEGHKLIVDSICGEVLEITKRTYPEDG